MVLGISMDSPAANDAFAKQIGVTFPLLSDMNRKVLAAYGILRTHEFAGGEFPSAVRSTFVVDKEGIIRHIEQGAGAVDPSAAVAACAMLRRDGVK